LGLIAKVDRNFVFLTVNSGKLGNYFSYDYAFFESHVLGLIGGVASSDSLWRIKKNSGNNYPASIVADSKTNCCRVFSRLHNRIVVCTHLIMLSATLLFDKTNSIHLSLF